jgi:hypothetical protein
MTDRELLELAAKAAGNPIGTSRAGGGLLMANGLYWSPLTDDGDAFRLAVKLHMRYDVFVEAACVTVHCARPAAEIIWLHLSEGLYQVEETVSTRRAIVRAAAEIGRSMK